MDNVQIDSRSVATNNMYTSAFRGFGATQACIAYEQQMDEAETNSRAIISIEKDIEYMRASLERIEELVAGAN